MFPGGPGNASEAYYSYVIQQALSSLKKVLGMDYAGIWIKSGEHLIPVNETGVSDYINEAVISGQIKEADTDTRKTGKYFYLCASESNNGGVDAVFTFRTTESEPFGYLLLDDVDNARELSNEETESVCKVFFESLYVLLIERDNASLRRENSALRNQMEQVANVSKIDSTTGLMNKKTFDDSLK